MRSQVVVNADDFGLSTGTNKAILEAHINGILTSASLFANGPAFDNALSILKKHPTLGVGAHLTLTIGKSILPPHAIPLLVSKDGYFNNNFLNLVIKSTLNSEFRKQIKAEWKAQVEYLINNNVEVDHLNGQEHVQMIPSIFNIVADLSKEYKIKAIRLSRDCVPLSIRYIVSNPPPIQNIIKFLILNFLSIFNSHVINEFTGVFYTRQMTKSVLIEIFRNLNKHNRRIEVLLHPGYFDVTNEDFDYKRQHIYSFMAHKNRLEELKSLTNKDVVNEAKNCDLVRFSDF